ncbi:hypothetical protein PCANC_15577 [Puccinia coronata f. sp. avenae]|uniref:Uncharacterized protein n=1 Tax=Puccinia coronata f. sp. avenae TaxID=200324 RepID=A0A2N5SKE3_9BASI|nr:hypothetical protein PCANC_15577 [Puccinia coronata f. sp. avenae]
MADWQLGPTVPAGRLVVGNNCPSWQTGSQNQQYQLADWDTWSQAETWSFILGQRQSQSNSWDQSSSWRSKAGAGQVDYGG